jgi:hypothetical protein
MPYRILLFLLALVPAACAAGQGDALRECGFFMARVQFASDSREANPWNLYPGADRNLIEEMNHSLRCRVDVPLGCNSRDPWTGDDSLFNGVADLHSPETLRDFPFLLMTSDGCFALDTQQKANLKQYLEAGGFLLLDDCISDNGSPDHFYQCAYLMLEDLFGEGAVESVPLDHEIFHNVYDLRDIGLPYMQGINHGAQGVFLDGRLAVLLSSTDLHCGWVDRNRTRFGDGRFGPHSYDEAIQMGINLAMYVMAH